MSKSRGVQRQHATALERHPKSAAIIRDIVNRRGTYPVIGRRHGISVTQITLWVQRSLAVYVQETAKRKSMRTVEGLLAKLESITEKVDQDIAAFHDYLADPDDPSKLWMGLQAEEIIAHYETEKEVPDGKGGLRTVTTRRKSQMSELIQRQADQGRHVFDITVKRDDTRRLYHDAMRLALEVIDRVAKLQGMMKDVHINVNRTEVYLGVIAEVRKAVQGVPGAVEAISAYIEKNADMDPPDA